MPLMFNTILLDAGFSLSDVRLLRHKDNSSAKGRSPYELWRDDRPSFDLYQATQQIKNASRLKAPYWASFIGTPANETLFAGIYSVATPKILQQDTPMLHRDGIDKAGSCHVYSLSLDSRLGEFIGKLVIEWGTGDRAWIQRADKQNKEIIEVRKEFKEPEFPGFLNFIKPLSELNSLPQSWIAVLKSSRGIYLLTCPKTKEQYIGSATGADGFWGRWQNYIQNIHGGNVALKGREPSDYQVSILEVAGTVVTDSNILEKEVLWKQKLQSREMGLNRN